MKSKAVYVVFLIFLVGSCKQKLSVKKTPEGEVIIESQDANSINISSIAPIIQGIWLPREYVQDLYETHSAFLAYRSIPEIAEIQINPDEIKNDTLNVVSSLNNHEGYGFKIWFKENDGKITIESDVRDWDSEKFNFELGYQINPDTILQLITKDKSGNIRSTIDYIRVRDKEFITNFGGPGYEFLARKVLLNGTYEILDSVKTSLGKVTFDADDGSIEGFKFKSYTFLTDFGGGPDFEGDHIVLSNEKENPENTQVFVLKQVSDTLMMLDSEEIDSGGDYKFVLKDKKYYLIPE